MAFAAQATLINYHHFDCFPIHIGLLALHCVYNDCRVEEGNIYNSNISKKKKIRFSIVWSEYLIIFTYLIVGARFVIISYVDRMSVKLNENYERDK